MAKLHLSIERLVLDGWPLDARQARQLQASLEAELSRLFESEPPTHSFVEDASLAKLQSAPITWNPQAGPVEFGQQLGQSVHRSLES